MINVELFCCSGGLAAGFRRAGIEFDIAIDLDPDHCDSYERNLGHRPAQCDVVALLAVIRRIRRGEAVPEGPVCELARRLMSTQIDLLAADPPCTPWSRAGKRMGQADERDMLAVTCTLIAILRPRRYLIGNIPGLEDGVNLHVVHRTIGALAQRERGGYCVADFLLLDAASFGTPQHRWRPWWYGHQSGPCLRPPLATHTDPVSAARPVLPGFAALKPWVTCRQALAHLSPEDLGRPVRMRRRAPATRHDAPVHTGAEDEPARTVTTQCPAPGHATTIVFNARHRPADADAPAPTLGAKYRGQGAQVLVMEPRHPPSHIDEPAMTVRAGGGTNRALMLDGEMPRRKRPSSTKGPQSTRTIDPDGPSTTVHAREYRVGSGSPVLEWPWDRPATVVTSRAGLAPPGHHNEDFSIMSLPNAVILSERAAMLLQGFPADWVVCGATKKVRWGQIGMATPPALGEAVASSIVEQQRDQAEITLGVG